VGFIVKQNHEWKELKKWEKVEENRKKNKIKDGKPV
jgi:hypothetical protein